MDLLKEATKDLFKQVRRGNLNNSGQMVQEFDQVVFSGELNKVHGPVKTQFGYHLLEITSRTD